MPRLPALFSSANSTTFCKPRFLIGDIVRRLSTVPQVVGPIDVADFRERAFAAGKPLVIRSRSHSNHAPAEAQSNNETPSVTLPALTKWFASSRQDDGVDLSPDLRQHSSVILPYELILPASTRPFRPRIPILGFLSWLSESPSKLHQQLASLLQHHITVNHPQPQAFQLQPTRPNTDTPTHTNNTSSEEETFFLRFDAPLALLCAALEFNNTAQHHHPPLSELYIAQASLSLLPEALQSDLPTPALVQQAGKGDVYSSSIWLGLEPTYTPWHRDPNPNLFCQLCGEKVVRLLPPRQGEALFRAVQARLLLGHGQVGAESARIRGEEMMQGLERRGLKEAVWGGGKEDRDETMRRDMVQAVVGPGDVLFIPLGWWHSVRSGGEVEGRLNGSVNWWFR
ncbi:Clavaminate synthase-like protein [Canariomyces notabilis]|uniref:Clavaminate synthase-like protein n=1 Tax=Canariomyces notabilis TaxID=2074819 RepID=A0AAN6QIR5_9PEZI|nr:Clavaminate synthase-like protein [Canariomyces arenarius]